MLAVNWSLNTENMFFVLSKVLLFLLSPVIWILIFLIRGLVISDPRKKKRAYITALIISLIFSNPWLFGSIARKWDVQPVTFAAGSRYDCAIVLGGFNGVDRHGMGYFTFSADRFIQAVKLYKTGVVSHLVITGGSGKLFGDNFKYSSWVANELKSVGIPDTAIVVDNLSRNTEENAMFTKRILATRNLKPPYVLVTSAFHMRRAMFIFHSFDIDVKPFPCNYFAGLGTPGWQDFIPQISMLTSWTIYTKEMVGFCVYKLRGFFKH